MKNKNFTTILFALIIIISGGIGKGSAAAANDTITVSTDSCMANFSYYSDGTGTVYFSDSTRTDSPIILRQWDFGDDSTSTDKDPVHFYAPDITKATICLLVQTDSGSCNVCQQITVRQTSETCTADFSYTPMLTADSSSSVFSPTYSFTDVSSASSPITWRKWNFPDSVSYTDSTFVHSFDASQSEATVCLTIGSASGCQASVCKKIILKDCFADFSYSSYQSGTVSYYNQSQVVLNAASWFWDFGDGTTSGQLNPVHTYASNVYQANACLTVLTSTDSCTVCKTVYIKNQADTACQAEFVYNKIDSTSETSQYMFTDVSSAYSGVAWRTWTISDSTTYNDSTFVHTFNSSLGRATVCLSIGTNSGCSSTKCLDINMTDTVPYNYCNADFSYGIVLDSTNESIVPRYIVYFTNLSYSSGSIDYQQWSLGDGTFSEEVNPSHYYYSTDSNSSVLVSLYIHSTTGCTDSIAKMIYFPGKQNTWSMSGFVQGNSEPLFQGIIVLYKKAEDGTFALQDADIFSNGIFNFSQLNQGKYILYAIPDIYSSTSYYPTYYVNKLHWKKADVIDLNSNVGGLNIQMVPIHGLEKGIGRISGTISSYEKSTSNNLQSESLMSEVSTSVYLYSPAGEILAMCVTDENNSFHFDELPYGNYILKVEMLNLAENATSVTLSPDMPEVNNLELNPYNTTGVAKILQQAELIVHNLNENNVAVRISQSGKYRISIFNLSGKLVIDKEINTDANAANVISVSSIPKGVYIIKAQSKTRLLIAKFLKQ